MTGDSPKIAKNRRLPTLPLYYPPLLLSRQREEADVLVSHATFISALSRFKKLFERIVKDFEKSDDFYYLINAYEEAIELSLKHNLIIYLDT